MAESDWKVLRQLQPLLLDRYCQRVLDEAVQISTSTSETHHKRYLRVYRLLQKKDDMLARVFDDIRRSNAPDKVGMIRQLGLFTDEEFERFRPETRAWIDEIASTSV